MPADSPITLYLQSNLPDLVTVVDPLFKKDGLKVTDKSTSRRDYQIIFIDVTLPPEENFTTAFLDLTNRPEVKTCLVLIDSSLIVKSSYDYYLNIVQPLLNDPNVDLRVIHTYDLFTSDNQVPLGQFSTLLNSTILDHSLHVSEKGDKELYPTALPDLVQAIKKSLFSSNTAGQVFLVVGDALTDLEFAYLLKDRLTPHEINLDINLDLAPSPSPDISQEAIRTQADLNWLPTQGLAALVSDIVSKTLQNKPTPIRQTPPLEPVFHYQPLKETPVAHLEPISDVKPIVVAKNPRRLNFRLFFGRLPKIGIPHRKPLYPSVDFDLHAQEKRGFKKIFIGFIFLLVLTFILPFLLFLGSSYLSSKTTYASFNDLRQGSLSNAKKKLSQARLYQSISVTTFHYYSGFFNLISPNNTSQLNDYLYLIDHIQSVLDSALQTYSFSDNLYQILLGKTPGDTTSLVSALKVNLISLNDNLSQIQLFIKESKLPFNLDSKVSLGDINSRVTVIKSQITSALPMLDLFEKITSNQKLQQYLVIIQDNNEIRATGGFLNTAALITFNQGKLINIQVESALAVDRLIQGKVDSPEILKTLLGQPNLTFRDANFDADFSKSATTVSWLYQRFKNTNLDGVIGLNLEFYKALLKEIGGLKVNDQSINQDNLALLAANPTSNTGSDTITDLTKVLSDRLLAGQIPFVSLARAGISSISLNEVNFWLADSNLESLSDRSGLSGIIKPAKCHNQLISFNCISDTIYLNETNFSVAKTNYYLRRTQNLVTDIASNGQITHTLTYDYSYPVPAPTNLNQVYKAYYQLYLPYGALDLSITIDGQPLDNKLMVQSTVNGLLKTEFSSLQNLNQNHRLVIKLVSPLALNLKSPQLAYSVTFLKQPGTSLDKFSYTLHYPQTLQPKTLTLPLKITGSGEMTYQPDLYNQTGIGVLFKNTAI